MSSYGSATRGLRGTRVSLNGPGVTQRINMVLLQVALYILDSHGFARAAEPSEFMSSCIRGHNLGGLNHARPRGT